MIYKDGSIFRKKIVGVVTYLNRNDGTLKEKIIRSGFWVGASSIGLNFLQFIRTVILVRLLTPDAFGLLGLCLIVTRAIAVLTETGFGAALIQRKSFEEARDTAFTLTVARGFVLAVLASAISPVAAYYFNIEILTPAIIVLSLGFIVEGFYNINAISHQRNLDFRRLTYIDYISSLSNLVLVTLAAYLLKSFWALIFSQFITSLLKTVFSYVILSDKPRFKFDKKVAAELFRYGKFITGVAIVGFFSTEVGNAIIGKVLGTEALGYYIVAFSLANLPTTHISHIIMKVMFPVYASVQFDRQALREVYIRVVRIVIAVAIPITSGVLILSPEIVFVLYGPKWSAAADIVRILSIYGCILSIVSLNGWVFNAIGKPNIPFYLNIGRLILMMILIFPLLSLYQVRGVALAVTIPIIAHAVISTILFKRIVGIELSKIAAYIMRSLFVSFLMTLSIMICKHFVFVTNALTLAVYVGVGMIAFALMNYRYIVRIVRQGA